MFSFSFSFSFWFLFLHFSHRQLPLDWPRCAVAFLINSHGLRCHSQLALSCLEFAEFNDDVHFFCFRSEMPFLGKFGPKSQNYQLKLKFGIHPNSSMQNSMVVFTFLVFDQKCLFWANLAQNVKIVSLRLNLVVSLIRIFRIQRWCSL